MRHSVKRWIQSVQASFRSRSAAPVRGPRGTPGATLRLESLEDRTVPAITAIDQGSSLNITTDAEGTNLTMSASGGVLTLSSTSHQINGVPLVGGVSTVTFNLTDFDAIHVLPGAVDATIFSNVEIQGSAAFANETIIAGGALVDVTTGPLSVNGLTLNSQQLGAAIDLDQQINSTGAVNLHPYSGNVVLRAPIVASGQTVSLISGVLQTNFFTVTQTSAGVITADSLYAEAGGGVTLNAANQISRVAGKVFAYGFLVDPAANPPGDFSVNSALDLTVGTVNSGWPTTNPVSVSGVTTTNGSVTLTTSAGRSITADEAITAGGAGKTATLAADAFDFDATKAITADNVVLRTVGVSANLTLGGAGLTNADLDAINATNLTLQASGTITVSGAITLGDDVSQVITLKAPSVNVANNISGNSSTGTLRFETDSLAFNGAVSKSVSAPVVEITTTQNVTFGNTFNFGGMDFTSNELTALDEDIVGTLRFVTTGDITFADVATNFNNGTVLKSGGVVALKAGGAITDANGGSVTASILAAVGGSVALDSASNAIGTLAGSASTGDFVVRSSGDLAIGSVDVGGRGVGASGVTVSAAGRRADLQSGGTLVVSASISAATLKVLSGTDGTGNITARAGVTITAGVQSYIAGDGPGGANGAFVDLFTNSPTFAGAITDFRVEVDAAFASNVLPTVAQFSTARPTNYSILSRAGGITILSGDGSRVSNSAGGTLLLSGLGSVALRDSIDRGSAGTILLQSTGNSVSQNGAAALTAGTISARASTGVTLDVSTNIASSIALQTNTGNVRFQGQGSFTLAQVAASTDYAGAAGMRSNAGNIRIQSTTAGATVTQTASSPIEGGGLELVGNNAAFQLAAAGNQVATIAGNVGAAGISQIIFRDTTGDLAVGTVGATNGLTAGVGIALQSDSGSITQSQAVATSDFGVVAATGINLGTQTNNVGELSARTTAGDVRFKNQSGLVIGSVGSGLGFGGSSGVSTPGLFSLEIAAAGAAVTQNVTRTINAASVELLGPVDFDLGANANAAGALAVGGGGAKSVTFRNSGNLNIDTVDGTAGVTAATVKLQSDSGDLTQSATGVIAATTLGVQAQTNITLNTVDNNVLTLALGTDAAGAIAFKNDSGTTLTIGTVGAVTGIRSAAAGTSVAITTADDLTVAAPVQTTGGLKLNSVQLTSSEGGVSQAAMAAIRANTLGIQTQGDVSLAGRVEVGLGDATVTTGGAVDLTGVLALTIAAANNFSDLNVTAASVDLTGADLELAGSYAPVAGNAFAIVTGTNQTGTFDGQAQNSVRTFNGATLRFNYAATSATLTALGAPTANGQSVTVGQNGTSFPIPLSGTDPNSPALPLTYTITDQPDHGTLSGSGANLIYTPNPGYTGPDSFKFTVSNGYFTSTAATVSVTVAAAPTIANVTPAAWTINRPGFTGSLAIMGGSPTYTITNKTGLPPGLTAVLNGGGTAIVFTGTPTALGTFTGSVTLKDGSGAVVTKQVIIKINAALSLTNLTTTAWTVTKAGFTGKLTLSGGTPAHALTSQTGLPRGLTAVLTGNTVSFTGTPSTAGTFKGSITITDSSGAKITKLFTIVINAVPKFTLAESALPKYIVGAAYNRAISVTGGTGALKVALVSVSAPLPTGMKLTMSGSTFILSGTPTILRAPIQITLRVTDSLGVQKTVVFSLTGQQNPARRWL